MANGMMNIANAGSPMMQGMNPQFDTNMQMDMYNQRMAGPQIQGAPGGGQSGNHALQDYQMQLMLLEQQNKKRLMMARQEQDNAVNRDGGPGAPMVGMQPGGMSPGSRTGTSPNPVDQMKRTPQLGGIPGSPSAGEEDTTKKRPAKKNSTANAPATENEPPETPTPSTPITPGHPQGFNLDFSSLENSDVLENFDFDSFLNTSNEDAFNFDNNMGIGGDFSVETNE